MKHPAWRALPLLVLLLICLQQPIAVRGQQDELELELESETALLMEAGTGEIIYSKNADEQRFPASLTKIMTMYLTFEALEEGRIELGDLVEASHRAQSVGGSQIWLESGEEMSVEELLYAVAVGSANDASVALAEHISGSEEAFAEKMNEKAHELGLESTHFVNSHGLPLNNAERHHMSAMDTARLSRHAIHRFPEMLEMTSVWEYYLRTDRADEEENGATWLVNFNHLVNKYPGTDGLKTGYTQEAGYCVAATAERDGLRFIAVVMGSPDVETRDEEASLLLDRGFSMYRALDIVGQNERVSEQPVQWGKTAIVGLVAEGELSIPFPRDETAQIEKKIEIYREIKAPISRDEKLGRLVVGTEDRRIASVELVADRNIERAGFLGISWQILRNFLEDIF